MKLYIILTGMLLLLGSEIHACSGGTSAGTLVPTTSYQTQAITSNTYYSINVTCGSTYNFTFCSNGGSASWDTQITILDNAGTTTLAYNDDFCSLQSQVSYTANFTGTIRVLINLYNCSTSTSNTGTLAYNSISTSVNYNASCTSATAIISGATGGTFAFSPIPGDGATINSSTGAISNATESTSYNVTYTYCGGTLNIPVTTGASPCYSLNGNAQYITVDGEQCIQLTAEINNQTGCAWNGSLIDFNSDFSLSLDYYFGNNINGADGNTFTFQPSSSTACGQAGGQLGAGGLANALSIEFDTYDNDNPTHLYDMSCDHIAVEIDGDMQNVAPYCGPVCAKAGGGNIDDGGTYTVEITWDASAQQLSVYFDGDLRLNCTGDFVNTVFGGQNNVYWGATSATGGLNNQQYFCPSTVIVLPSELISFESNCQDETEILIWKTASEDRLDYFQIEHTTNGIVFYELGKVKAVGHSTELQTYYLPIYERSNYLRYYRITSVDMDGKSETSGLIAGNNCSELSVDFLLGYSFSNNYLNVFLNGEDFDLKLLSPTGQEISSNFYQSKANFTNQNLLVSTGMYLLQITNKTSGETEVHRIFHTRD